MRNDTNGFVTGMLTGAALGALVVMAMTPQVRQPMVQSMGAMGRGMRRMMRRGGNMSNMIGAIMPGDAD